MPNYIHHVNPYSSIDTTAAWKKLRFILFVRSDFHMIDSLLIAGSCRIETAVWMHYMDANKTAGEEDRRQLHKNVASKIEQVLVASPHKTPTIRPPASHHENYPS